MSGFWWERAGRPPIDDLEVVIVSLDRALNAGDGAVMREMVWDLHCDGIRVAAVTSLRGPSIRRAVRDLLGDGAVELLLTGDDVGASRADPEVYHLVLWELGVRAENALAVEDSVDALRAAMEAGLAAVLAENTPLSVYRCRRARERWLTGALSG